MAGVPEGLSRSAMLVATFFGSGLLRPAPGTWGTLAALPPAIAIHAYLGPVALACAALLAFGIGLWACQRWQSAAPEDNDPGTIVIDEAYAVWLVLAALPLAPLSITLGFVLFRLFDITKPWPVRWADQKLHGPTYGPWGIMLDDFFAACWAIGVAHLALLAVSF